MSTASGSAGGPTNPRSKDVDHRYRLLVDAVQDYAIFMVDPSGYITSWNAGAERLKGYGEEEIVGQHVRVFYTDEDLAKGRPGQLLAAARACGRVETEGWRLRKDGSRFWANVVVTAIHDDGGAPLGFVKITRDLTERRRLEELERSAAVALQVEQVRENEQKRIARELHDDLGQQITALKLSLALHEAELAENAPAAICARLQHIHTLGPQIDAMAMSVRRIAAALRPAILDDLGLEAALGWLADGFEQRHGLSVHCDFALNDVEPDELTAISIFRITQEALTNVARHAKARTVDLSLSADERECRLQIRDDGVGMSEQRAPRADAFGLVGMRERIVQLGGVLSVQSTPGRGVTVSARVPRAGIDARMPRNPDQTSRNAR
ncbi:PAS domain-containing sensor histidine kinase [Paraburkholderia graminis]|uniref:PAS domain S-box-containing protein n=1 Tax=Paraburkholderia graminis TaxID=60548 RepID=A0ABD5CU32_9BURK|nr:PAS domain-containing sensor histidine kinase [Paraburkholderia graminis]MDR6207854.1 PAS domain S-box-containing protein [Paraburkholderia graminis]